MAGNCYYVEYPRDFANEYSVYVVAADGAGRLERLLPDAGRITRREALRLGYARPRQARRDGEQWFGGFAGAFSGDALADQLRDALRGTEDRLRDAESAAWARGEMAHAYD